MSGTSQYPVVAKTRLECSPSRTSRRAKLQLFAPPDPQSHLRRQCAPLAVLDCDHPCRLKLSFELGTARTAQKQETAGFQCHPACHRLELPQSSAAGQQFFGLPWRSVLFVPGRQRIETKKQLRSSGYGSTFGEADHLISFYLHQTHSGTPATGPGHFQGRASQDSAPCCRMGRIAHSNNRSSSQKHPLSTH